MPEVVVMKNLVDVLLSKNILRTFLWKIYVLVKSTIVCLHYLLIQYTNWFFFDCVVLISLLMAQVGLGMIYLVRTQNIPKN